MPCQGCLRAETANAEPSLPDLGHTSVGRLSIVITEIASPIFHELLRNGRKKHYLKSHRFDLSVGLHQIELSNGEIIQTYDTTGPYTDPLLMSSIQSDLPPLSFRSKVPGKTQLYYAKKALSRLKWNMLP